LTQIPGRLPQISAFLVYNDLAYTIVITPLDLSNSSYGDAGQDAAAIWDAFLNSFTLFDPQPAAVPSANLENCTLDSEFVADLTIPDGTIVVPGQMIIKKWALRNSGTCDWGVGFEYAQTNTAETDFLADPAAINLPLAAPGAEVEVMVMITLSDSAPSGNHIAQFQMRTGDGEFFGGTPYASVQSFGNTASCPQFLPGLNSYIDGNVGACFLYGADDMVVDNPDQSSVTVTIPGDPDCNCDDPSIVLTITNLGDVGGLTLQEFADQQLAPWMSAEIPPNISDTTIAGNPAVLAEELGLPAQFGTTEAYLIVNGNGYVIHLAPAGLDEGRLWDIVIGSIQFFE
jgi:hypothetical protein